MFIAGEIVAHVQRRRLVAESSHHERGLAWLLLRPTACVTMPIIEFILVIACHSLDSIKSVRARKVMTVPVQ